MAATLDLFKGVQAVEDAGGVDGFAREVLAETKATAFRTIREQGITDEAEGKRLLTVTLAEIVSRRLQPDVMREAEIEIGELLESTDAGPEAIQQQVMGMMRERMRWRVEAIAQAGF